jgi:NADP-dependent 3-hydroxy acid dehydrogenase YdfG
MRTLDAKVVVITGAASGIGRALAVACAERGALLALSDVDDAGLAETAALAESAGAREVRCDHLDVGDRAAYSAYAHAVADHFGRVNVLVNNAGVTVAGDIADLDYDDLDWIVATNLWGVVHGTKEFLPHLIESGDGHVVTLSSLFGLISVPGQGAYNLTKYAVRGFSEALRAEMLVERHPVGVTVVHPGGVRTSVVRNARAVAGLDRAEVARRFDEQLARTEPEKAAEVIVRGVLAGKARVLVGADAHLVHHLAKLLGARYQDLVAHRVRRTRAARSRVPAASGSSIVR